MWEALSSIFTYQLVHASIRCTVPIVYACLACSICKQANVFNMSAEGVMLFSCFIAAAVSYKTGNWMLAIFVCILFGVLISAFIAYATMKLNANIVVLAIAFNMFAISGTRFLMLKVFGISGSFTSKDMVGIPSLNISALDDYPVLSSLFSGYGILELLCPLCILLLWFLLYKTVWGLRLRTVGLNVMCAKTAGIEPTKYQVHALLISGVLSALAGAHMSLGYVTMFSENMSNGRGYMGLAAMQFGAANPFIASLACLIFGFCEALGTRIQQIGIPSQFVLMLPYLVTVIVLVIAMAQLARKERAQQSARKYLEQVSSQNSNIG